ncbi:MAG TPA: hypothetical protein DCM40_31690, partial [Maribacter sp.]|nr:hypothetical protein [Maribacter sp.]
MAKRNQDRIMNYTRDIFYLTALILVVVAGCQTPLGKFNKQKEVVENIQKKEDANKEQQLESGRTFVYAADQAL